MFNELNYFKEKELFFLEQLDLKKNVQKLPRLSCYKCNISDNNTSLFRHFLFIYLIKMPFKAFRNFAVLPPNLSESFFYIKILKNFETDAKNRKIFR